MAWKSLETRFSNKELPLVLAGPILRRTEPNSVTVWIALQEQRTVTLNVRDLKGKVLLSGTRATVSLGKRLHVVAVTADEGGTVSPGQIYLYDLLLGNGQNLDSPGVLDAGTPPPTTVIHYVYGRPSFSLPPEDLNNLSLLHASCRKPHGEGADALSAVHEIIRAQPADANKRPHQLFLTGDQIYADDVADALLFMLSDAATALLGPERQELLPGVNKKASELLPGTRADIVRRICMFTSSACKSHLMSLGEFYAMYLFAWSPVLWPSQLPEFQDVFPGAPRVITKTERDAFGAGRVEQYSPMYSDYLTETPHLLRFRDTLSDVRHALANIPTYMILDDHEITDDWYITFDWCEGVLTNPLGRRVVQNGLLAYAVFQAWGNTPEQFSSKSSLGTVGVDLLAAASRWDGVDTWPEADTIAKQVGMPKWDDVANNKTLDHTPDSLKWHYSVGGPKHEVIVLDTRTWRGFPGDGPMDPPALLSERAFTEQIKKEALHPDGLTIVIVPTNLISIPLLHSRVVKGLLMGQWLLSGRRREYDLAYGPDEGDPWHGQTGPYEAFLVALSERGAEVNGKKESRVVVLGGDIHFSYASRLGYWAKHPYQATSDSPRRLVVAHLTSSSLKHQVSLTEFLHKHGYGWPPRQFQWIGWNRPPGKTGVVIGTEWERNRGAEYFKLQKPYFLSRSPAMLLLTDISPDSSVTVEPDWRYRIDFLNAILGPANDGIETIDLPSAAKPNQWWLSESKKAAEAHRKYITDKSGSEIIGVTNLALLQFKWNSDDDKSVTQSNWWRLTDQTHIAELNRYEVSLALDDANFAMPKYPDES